MNRRSFLQAGAAAGLAALVPSWLVPAKRPSYSVDLTAFCWKRPWHTHYRNGKPLQMALPFAQESPDGQMLRYATDGRVCVRVGIHPGDLIDCDREDLPKAGALPWWRQKERGRWRPWPRQAHILAADTECPRCFGTGDLAGVGEECEACEGTGDEWTQSNWDRCLPITCRTCNGVGHIVKEPCPTCKGSPIATYPGLQRLEHVYVAAEYDRKVRGLEGVEYFVPESPQPDRGYPVRFRFHAGDGRESGLGLLMPIDTAAAERRIRDARS